MEKRKDIIDDEMNDTEHEKFLAYGEFDRIGFERITRFSRFRDVPVKSKIWIGDQQTLLIYDITDGEYEDSVLYSEGSFYLKDKMKVVRAEQLFIGITILQFKDSQKKNRSDMGGFLQKCKMNILKLVKKEMPHIKCSVLGTLGSFGLTIIWLADQYCDILQMVTKIRNTDITDDNQKESRSVFLSAYTIFAQNHRYGADWDKRVEKIEGEAVLRFTLKRGVSEGILDAFRKWQIKGTEIYHSAGEHDIVVRMKSVDAFNIFLNAEELDINEKFVTDNVLQTSLQLCEDIKKNKNHDFSYSEDKREVREDMGERVIPLPELESIQENCKKLRIQFKKFPSTAGMIDTLDLLYIDYIAKISTASNEMWVSNFSYQFLKILECLTKFVDNLSDVDMMKREALQIINDLLSDFERQVSHIAESNNLILGTPSCQFRYSGQNNLTLYSYFGIIKSVLSTIYKNQEVSSQAEIVPLIVADIVPIIKSNLFIDYNNRNDTRIITINLPIMSLYDPVCYYPYFLHEIAHYVVPKDRIARNRILGCIISIEMLNAICTEVMRQKQKMGTIEEEKQLNVLFKDCFFAYTYSFVIEHFQKYIGTEQEDYRTYLNADQKALTADEYEKQIYLKWLEWINAEDKIDLTNNPIYLFLCYLYNSKKNLTEKLNRWNKKKSEIGEDCGAFIASITDFVGNLDCLADNPVQDTLNENFRELMNYIGDEICEDAMNLTVAVKEALADIVMVTMGNMELAEYLLLFTKTKRELLLDCEENRINTQDIIRIGMILDYLCRQKEDDDILIGIFDNAKQDFIDMYYGLYYVNFKSEEEETELCHEAEKWFDYWRICFQQYDLRYRIYATLFRELQKQLLLATGRESTENGREESIYWKQYADMLKEYGNYIRCNNHNRNEEQWKEKRAFVDDRIFKLNIDLIHKFQYQEDFKDINQIRENRIEGQRNTAYEKPEFPYDSLKVDKEVFLSERTGRRHYLWKYEISSVGELGELTACIAEQLKKSNSRVLGKNEYPIWYRGQQSVDYKLIPSIMRKYKKQKAKEKNNKDFSLVTFIRKEFEEFRFRSDGSQETIDRIGYTVGDYIALMQHYSVASNFLDWTEDALSALYFALEGFLDEKIEKTDTDAALYVFSPALYNHARKRMLLKSLEDKRKMGLEKEVINNAQDGIPNLTVPFNEGKYEMYLLGKDEYGDDNSRPFTTLEERDRKLAFYLPIAIYVPRLNRRIRAQSGIFLAYNIYTCPDVNDEFDYISLERIQEHYFEIFRKDTDEELCPFLYKIAIKKQEREKVASWVSSFGMSKEKCYPELSNIGERIMK